MVMWSAIQLLLKAAELDPNTHTHTHTIHTHTHTHTIHTHTQITHIHTHSLTHSNPIAAQGGGVGPQ